jgi:autotransporter-associated beta strand protein
LFVVAAAAVLAITGAASAQSTGNRLLGLDVSAHQGDISQPTWTNICTIENRQFVFIRASRGGTTGEDHRQGGYPSSDNTYFNLSERYDDPYFIQNINRATAAGMFVGSYHFSRPDVIATTQNSGGIASTGSNEADHFIQMAGAFMRPGYLPPVHDFEAGDGLRTSSEMATFALDFSNRIYQVLGIRPAIYINGNYADSILGGASALQRSQLAQQSSNPPNPAGPAYAQLWTARWPNQSDPNSIAVQTAHPKDSYTPVYGPWDDYGVTHPWAFWQYASTGRLNSFNNASSNLDFDVVQGGVEYLKDQLIPALWWNDSSGDWSTLANWNSGQPPIVPIASPGQLTPAATGPLPTPRLPGAAGSGPTSGQNDTVVLDRPNANITVTLSTGSHNIRKLYVREALNITGGSLTINYVPVAESTPMSGQFSAPVSISGGASLSVHTLYVDPATTFTAGNASLTFDTLGLLRGPTPAKLLVNGDLTITGLSGATAKIVTINAGAPSGLVDLSGGTRTFNVVNGAAAIDLDISVPITNGGLTKTGAGTMALSGTSNTFAGGVNIQNGTVTVPADGALGTGPVTGATPGTLNFTGTTNSSRSFNLNGGTLAVAATKTLTLDGGAVSGGTYLDGAGTIATAAVKGAIFNNAQSMPSVAITSNSPNDQFVHFNNSAALTVAPGVNNDGAGTTTNLNGFLNEGLGTVTVSASAKINVANFQSSGLVSVVPGPDPANASQITNVGASPLYFGGGSRTFLGNTTSIGGAANLNLNGQNAVVAGGLFVNNGNVFDLSGAGKTVIADFGALVKGAGNYQNSVVTQNGGRFQSGNSPGRSNFGDFTFGPGGVTNYLWQINDAGPSSVNPAAPGVAGPAPDAPNKVSGWSLVTTFEQTLPLGTTGNFRWTATPASKLTFALQSLLANSDTPGFGISGSDAPGPMSDFNLDLNYSWTVVHMTPGAVYTGPTDTAALDASTEFELTGFANTIAPGAQFHWVWDGANTNLNLVYAVPEPGSFVLSGLGLLAACWFRRRCDAPRGEQKGRSSLPSA